MQEIVGLISFSFSISFEGGLVVPTYIHSNTFNLRKNKEDKRKENH